MNKLQGVIKWMGNNKGLTIFLGCVILIVSLIVMANVHNNKKQAEQERLEEELEEEYEDEEQTLDEYMEELDEEAERDFEEDQAYLRREYGDPPKGFYWDDEGEAIAIGSEGKTEEDVVYTYLRSISTLDFSNAERYSYKSPTITQYQSYYTDVDSDYSYNVDFLRNIYKEVLLSLKPEEILDVANFAGNKTAITIQVETLDLKYKDFWLKDKDKLFDELRKYALVERDSVKMQDFLYDYVLEYYRTPTAKTKKSRVNLLLQKTKDGSWLVVNDIELDALAQYTDGELVVSQIMGEFDDWESRNEFDSGVDSGQGVGNHSDDLLDFDDGSFSEHGVVDWEEDREGY